MCSGYREADLRLCFRICKKRFSHNKAHIKILTKRSYQTNAIMYEFDSGFKIPNDISLSFIGVYLFIRGYVF